MWYRTALLVGVIVAVTGLKSLPVAAQAPTTVAPGIAVLDVDSIRRDAASIKAVREQIAKYRNSFQTEIDNEEKNLRTANQELAKKQSLLAPEAFAAERTKFEQRVVEVQRLVQKRRIELEKVQEEALGKIEQVVNEIVATMARDRGYSVVLKRGQTVVVDIKLDITKDVLAALDKRLPTVKVTTPGK
ncbi:MAG: OmpH family outer membrane protein [Proteobacteria bacterium]|nr:OmpH family outer membrane protein [Pseudomonadota bacterium]